MKTTRPIVPALLLALSLLAWPRASHAQPSCYSVIAIYPTNTVPCEGPWGAHVWFTVIASNICTGQSLPLTYSQPPGSVFPPGTTSVCVTNVTPGIPPFVYCFPITVDTCCGTNCIKLVCPPNFIFPCNPAVGGGALVDLTQPQFIPVLTNVCGGPVPTSYAVGCSPSPPAGGGPAFFPPGENLVMCCLTNLQTGYVDCCCYKILVLTNCLQTASTNCHVVAICPTNLTVCVTNSLGTTNVPFLAPKMINTCPNQPQPVIIGTPTYTMPPGSFFPLGKTTVGVCVRWLDDLTGTTGTNCCCYDVVVTCCTNPCDSILICPGDMVVPCPAAGSGIMLNYIAFGTNPCMPTTLECVPPPGTIIFGNTNVCCSLRGGGAVLTQCCFKVTVDCPTNCVPVLTCPSNIYVTCAGPRGAFVTYPSVTVTDTCGLPVTVLYNPPSGSFFPLGCRPVTVAAVNSAGVLSECKFLVCVLPAGCYLRNPSFEQPAVILQPTNACGGEPVDNAASWVTLAGTPMLFRPPAGVPVNCWGQELPCQGTNFAGLAGGYTSGTNFQTDQMMGRTVVPLNNGRLYRLRACLSLADNSPGPVYVEFVLSNHAETNQQYVVNRTWVTQKAGWQPVIAQPPCFVVPEGTNIWDALIIRAAQVPPTIGSYPVGQVYIDNVNICCCTPIRIVPGLNPTLTWVGSPTGGDTLLFSPGFGNPLGMMTLGTGFDADPDTGMSMLPLPQTLFDVFPMGFFQLISPEPDTTDCGCYQ